MTINLPIIKRVAILALGAESAGVFSFYKPESAVKPRSIRAGFLRDVSAPPNTLCRNRNKNGSIFISENFGDLLDNSNFLKYKSAVLAYLKKEKIKPDVILTDLHPLYNSAIFGAELAKKYKTSQIKVQHHIAHIFSAVGDKIINSDCHSEWSVSVVKNHLRMRDSAHLCEILRFAQNDKIILPNTFFGIAMDGTGYGLDGSIWGGEIFKFKVKSEKLKVIERIGSLEEQTMIGGDLAVREPARMLISILSKFLTKEKVYQYVKKYYSKNEFEALCSQREQNFNCQTTTSTGRILDAVSVLLGFAGNERKSKHEAVKLLEVNSTVPYNLEPRINPPNPLYKGGQRGILQTTPLFEYLIKNIHKDKMRLAATAQLYIAKGFYEIVKNNQNTKYQIPNTYFAGGMANNKIISSYLEKQGVYTSKKIPKGDEGIVMGQLVYYLLNK